MFLIRTVFKIFQINLKPLVKCKRVCPKIPYGKNTSSTHSLLGQTEASIRSLKVLQILADYQKFSEDRTI